MSFEIITKIDEIDNVAIANVAIMKGDVIPLPDKTITAKAEIPEGSIIALDDIKKGEYVIKYGFKAGIATVDIDHGDSLSSYNYTKKLDDIDSLCVALTKKHHSYISEKEDSVKDYSLRFGAYKANGTVGLLKSICVISSEEYSSLAKSLDENAIIVKEEKEVSSYLRHPNLACALVLGFDCEQTETIKAVVNPDFETANTALSALQEKAKEIKKTSYPLSELIVEFYGFNPNPSYNHMLGKLVDDLICLGVNVIIDISTPLGLSLKLIKEKLVDQNALSALPSPDESTVSDTELNYIQIFGKADIATIVSDDNPVQKGLNLCFQPTFKHSQIVLDLSGNLESTPLSPVLDMKSLKKGTEFSVESLLFDINRIISKNK